MIVTSTSRSYFWSGWNILIIFRGLSIDIINKESTLILVNCIKLITHYQTLVTFEICANTFVTVGCCENIFLIPIFDIDKYSSITIPTVGWHLQQLVIFEYFPLFFIFIIYSFIIFFKLPYSILDELFCEHPRKLIFCFEFMIIQFFILEIF